MSEHNPKIIEKAAQAVTALSHRWHWIDQTPTQHARAVLDAVADDLRAEAWDEGRAMYAAAWDDGVDAAFRGAVTRQNAADVKRDNPYRKEADRG